MSRTTIDLDDGLVARAMRLSGLKTQREVVDLALRRLLGVPTTEDIMSPRGIGWPDPQG
ncbi:MAG TPA: type II toxin-antitoxin system VapB family antitoxin [Pseudonocardiaceae bacterium]|jgi:Arc/MetJ family transcription regulator